jgi:hypothetical protein
LGLIKRKSDRTLYLDGQLIKPALKVDKKNKIFIMNDKAMEKMFIPKGPHIFELGWRSQVYAVVIKKGPGGSFEKPPPPIRTPIKLLINKSFGKFRNPLIGTPRRGALAAGGNFVNWRLK